SSTKSLISSFALPIRLLCWEVACFLFCSISEGKVLIASNVVTTVDEDYGVKRRQNVGHFKCQGGQYRKTFEGNILPVSLRLSNGVQKRR
ncbi:hypothetical protein NPIL_251431, partial [Nephila pilipes]